jgi:integrase
VPFFADQPLVEIGEGDVERFMGSMRRAGSSPKTIKNVMGTLHSLFDLAIRRKVLTGNPCRLVERPKVGGGDPDIRFLDQVELEAVLRAAPNVDAASCEQDWWRVERPLYLMAAMTGMRQGELRAVRWADLDWLAQKVRVRQSFVRGEFGAPKSRRSSRAVPLAPRVLAELDRLHKWTVFASDEDLVFCNPHTGRPMDRSKLLKHFKAACERASVRRVRFHDLRHTFGTRIAASGKVPMRTLQEWMGHRDFKTTLIYADYQPGNQEADLVQHAFSAEPMDSSMDRSERKTTEVGGTKTA